MQFLHYQTAVLACSCTPNPPPNHGISGQTTKPFFLSSRITSCPFPSHGTLFPQIAQNMPLLIPHGTQIVYELTSSSPMSLLQSSQIVILVFTPHQTQSSNPTFNFFICLFKQSSHFSRPSPIAGKLVFIFPHTEHSFGFCFGFIVSPTPHQLPYLHFEHIEIVHR